MAWLNTPVAIIENDQKLVEQITYVYGGNPPVSYRRSTRYITTRYVGCDYDAACAFRDTLLEMESGSVSVEAVVQAAGGGQYHIIATVKTTIGSWVEVT